MFYRDVHIGVSVEGTFRGKGYISEVLGTFRWPGALIGVISDSDWRTCKHPAFKV